jgi:hypothetical protein
MAERKTAITNVIWGIGILGALALIGMMAARRRHRKSGSTPEHRRAYSVTLEAPEKERKRQGMTATEQRIASGTALTSWWRSLGQRLGQGRWMTYGVYILFTVSVLTAAVSRAIGGLKPGDLLLLLFTALLLGRRVIRKDFSYQVTAIDTAFLFIMAAGTLFPLGLAIYRHIYISKETINALAGPVEYYLWYRVILEALPLPLRLTTMVKVIIVACSVISFVGVLQIFHFPGVENFLLALYPTYETAESPRIHRATSLVGGWEILAAISSYTILLINQIQTKDTTVQKLGRRWNIWLLVMLAFNVVALISTLSTAGLIAIVIGYVLAWRLNGGLARATRLALIAAVIGGLALTPYILQRFAFQFNNPATAGHHSAVPNTWATRGLHWSIVMATVLGGLGTFFFGVQPNFDYPVLSFGSTESLYLLLLYRGGLVYLIAFIAFIVIVCRYVWQVRQRAHGFNRQIMTGIFTILIVNFCIDVLDAHFFSAGEWQILITLLALAVGVGLHTDQQAPLVAADVGEHGTAMRAPAVRLPGQWEQYTRLGLVGLLGCTMLAGGAGLYRNRHLIPPASPMAVSYYDATVPVSQENQILGTRAWQISAGTNTAFIQGYADKASAQPGDTVHLFISTERYTGYDIDAFRLGWYYGLGGRQFFHAHVNQSQRQGYWDKGHLHGCACQPDPTSHLLDAHWQTSYTLTIPSDWVSGVYLIKLTAPEGASYIPLVVREAANATTHSEILVSLPVNTYQAFNTWGGYSMYGRDTGSGINPDNEFAADRATEVSFNRPYAGDAGAGQLLSYDIHAIRWLERSGFDVSYTTDVDLDANPTALEQHSVFLMLGHDEYWTKAMYDGLDHARDVGVSLGFLGGGDGYWQARLTSDDAGNADRTLVCYKVVSGPVPEIAGPYARSSPNLDPMYRHRATRFLSTARWRDPILSRPENELLGIQFDGFIQPSPTLTKKDAYLPDWHVRSGVPEPMEVDATFAPEQAVAGGLLGYAYDAPANNGLAPLNLSILGQSIVVDSQNRVRIADTVYYRTVSGGVVFDAGSIWWSWALDEFTFAHADQPNLLLGNQQVSTLTNLLVRAMLGAAHVPPPSTAPVQ